MRTVEIVPSASALLQSLRGFGYTPETALADLIDNSIAAGATAIEIVLDWNEGLPIARVLDDGRGMDETGLVQAMRFGGDGPGAERSDGDLGRFGLGLKTASLSQCRRLTVATRRGGETSALTWDVDEVIARHRWDALDPTPLPPSDQLAALLDRPNGTLVLWEQMDAMGGLSGLDRDTFFLRIRDVGAHLGMVFHRFLTGDARRISISLNDRPVRGWDPLQRGHPATITLPTEPIRHAGMAMSVTPYVLPHRDRFANESEYELAGGPGGWGERQGFYVYRGRRLLAPGGWLGLGGTRAWTRDESSRLARIAVDLPTDLDADWRIDVRKSQARPPGRLRPRLTAIAARCREKAQEVFAWRGGHSPARRQHGSRDEVWVSAGDGLSRYRIRRDHPAVALVASALGDRASLIDGLLALIERSVPVERIWLDVSDGEGAAVPSLEPGEVEGLAEQLAVLAKVMSGDVPAPDRVEQLLRCLPGDMTGLRQAILTKLETS